MEHLVGQFSLSRVTSVLPAVYYLLVGLDKPNVLKNDLLTHEGVSVFHEFPPVGTAVLHVVGKEHLWKRRNFILNVNNLAIFYTEDFVYMCVSLLLVFAPWIYVINKSSIHPISLCC